MDNPFLRFSLLILFFLFKFSSAFSQTQVNADITTPTTWTPGGSPYVVNTIIEVSSTLTIQAGVEVQYPAATMLEITGTLNVLGIKTDSVHFRSTGANPGAGIYFNGGSGSISHAIFDTLRQSASPTEGAAIYFKNANVSLDNCLVRGNMGSSRGLIYESGNVSIDSSSINTCVFGMIVKGGAPTVSNSSFTNNEDSDVVTYPQGVENFSNTQLDVIEITSTGSVTTKTFFPLIDSLETKYVLTNGLKITADTLFLDPGVTISFPGSEFLETSSSGVIWAVGNPQDTIRFLSTATGTNRGGIKIPSGKVRMSYTRIDDIIDGSTDYSAILVSGTGQLDYDHSLLKGLPQYSNSRGITFKGGNGQITESRIDSCNDGIFIWDGEPTITQCAFTNQSGADILTHPSGVSNVSNCDLQTVEFSMYFGQTNNVGSVPQTKSNAILPNINPLGTIYTMPSGLRIVDTLSLAPGVKMGFVNAGAIRVFGSGKLTAHGTKADSITFYSMNASPSFHGSGIWITNGEVDLAYCHFDKVGNTGGTNSSGGAVYFDGVNAKGTIRNSLFENGNYHGVRVNDGDVSVLNSTFIDFENGIYVDNGIPVLSNNKFTGNNTGIYAALGGFRVVSSHIAGNTNWGIRNQGVLDIYAKGCWWGHVTGPEHTVNNPLGLGDKISNKVIYDPIFQDSTFSEGFSIFGYDPKIGGNNGDVVLSFYGSGFHENVMVKLSRSGQPDIIIPDSNFFYISPTNIAIKADLRLKQTGLWSIIIQDTSIYDTTIIINDGFEILNGERPSIFAEIIGPSAIRPGRWSQYFLSVQNEGNIEAHGVPFWVAVPPDIEIEFQFELLEIISSNGLDFDTMSQFVYMDSLFGKPANMNLYGYIIPAIAAGGSSLISYRIKTNSTNQFRIMAWATPPIKGSPIDPEFVECTEAMADQIYGLNPITDCINSAANLATLPIDNYINDRSTPFIADTPEKATESYLYMMSETLLGCVLPGSKQVSKFAKEMWDLYSQGKNGFIALKECMETLPPIGTPDEKTIDGINSADPNEKHGPTGVGSPNYIHSSNSMGYIIYFENVDSATAAAQEVTILDTLDLGVFDISTFHFGPVSFGDTVIAPNIFRDSLWAYVDLRPSQNLLVEIKGKIDTTTGIIEWKFISLDPVTMNLTTDPFAGFLPPNMNEPEGEGSVYFSIKMKSSLPHNTLLSNNASIIFDSNSPILTGNWVNTLDNIKPTSSVNALPAFQADTNFTASWSGQDTGSGVRLFTVYYDVNLSGNYQIWLYRTFDTTFTFTGKNDSTYTFYVIAEDSVGNIESKSPIIEAQTTIDTSLPVELLSFQAKTLEDQTVLLAWETAFELNNEGFEIQRSRDGQTFTTIGWVDSKGNSSSLQKYQAIDEDPFSGANFYRLNQVDVDGSQTFSQVIEVFVEKLAIKIFPNPADQNLNMIISEEIEDAKWVLFDLYGRQIGIGEISDQKSQIDISSLAAGLYHLKILNRGKAFETKIVKQDK